MYTAGNEMVTASTQRRDLKTGNSHREGPKTPTVPTLEDPLQSRESMTRRVEVGDVENRRAKDVLSTKRRASETSDIQRERTNEAKPRSVFTLQSSSLADDQARYSQKGRLAHDRKRTQDQRT